MRINIFVNAPWGSTAYSNMARNFGPRLLRLGHEISMTTIWGLEGGMIEWCGIPIYPKALERLGRDIQAAHARHFKADVFMSWCDIFTIEPKRLQDMNLPWAPWFPIDAIPASPILVDLANAAKWPLVYSQFGMAELEKQGIIHAQYMPVGVDTNVFTIRDRTESREKMGFPTDRFIVGMVQANLRGNRKAIPHQIAAFRKLQKAHPDALLYVHSFQGDQMDGVDLVPLFEQQNMELGTDVLLAQQHAYIANLYGDESMVNLYNSFDCLLSVTKGEGFGVPIIESTACGTPAIVGGWSSMAELNFAGYMHDISESLLDYNQHFNVWWRIPNIDTIADLLFAVYNDNWTEDKRKVLRESVCEYDTDTIVRKRWMPLLADMEIEIADSNDSLTEERAFFDEKVYA